MCVCVRSNLEEARELLYDVMVQHIDDIKEKARHDTNV